MVDEHGRRERSRRVPDVLDRERGRVPAAPQAPAEPASAETEAPLESPARLAPGPGYWNGLDAAHRKRLVVGLIGGVLVLAVLIALSWALTITERPRVKAPAPTIVPTPDAQTYSGEPSPSAVSSAPATPATGTPAVAAAAPATRAPIIAYRAGATVWVAGQYGATPRGVYSSQSGAFSLSPDGRKLAVVDSVLRRLDIVDVVSGKVTRVGSALPARLDWAPDSSFVVYTRASQGDRADEVWRVSAGGSGAAKVVDGAAGRVMPDGKTIISVPASGGVPTDLVAVLSDGRRISGGDTATSIEVCPAAAGVYFSSTRTPQTGGSPSSSVRFVRYDGTGVRIVAAKTLTTSNAAFSDLTLSPNGDWLVYSEAGDDGYSRLFSVPTAGGVRKALTPRYDGQWLRWSSDGTELIYVEGNADQGEATRVSAIRPDGSGHRIIIEGGGL